MSGRVKCESSVRTPGVESFNHTFLRVKYSWSYECCVKLATAMSPRRSSRQSKASKKNPQRSSIPSEDGTKPRRGQKRTKYDDVVADADKGGDLDMVDIINGTSDGKHVEEEDEGTFAIADEGLDQSDEECRSVTSSVASGPSLPHNNAAKKQRPSVGMCSPCQKFYQRVLKMKGPIKNRLLDNDPNSATCDYWVLIKTWRPRRLPSAHGNLLSHVQMVKRRLRAKEKQAEQHVGQGEPSFCPRPHIFLKRNLRRCVQVPAKKRKKRRRDYSQSPRAANQKRRRSSIRHQHNGVESVDSNGLSISPVFEDCSGSDMDMDNLVLEVIPSSVTLCLTPKPKAVRSKQKSPKKTARFRDLLSRLRSNSSMIVRETC